MSSKPEITILCKSKSGGQTTEIGAAWAGKVFTGKYGNRQSYNFSPSRNVKKLTIVVETNDGEKFKFSPGKEGDAFVNIMMDVRNSFDDGEDF